jgi:transposase
MTDDEWAYFEPFLIHRGGGRPPRNHRRVLDAVFWLMRTGAPWRDLPEGFGNWNSIFRQFRRWADSGVWDVILEGLAGSGVSDAALQMIDATIIRAHHCAAGGKGGPSATRSVVRGSGWGRACQPYARSLPIPAAGPGSRFDDFPVPSCISMRQGPVFDCENLWCSRARKRWRSHPAIPLALRFAMRASVSVLTASLSTVSRN